MEMQPEEEDRGEKNQLQYADRAQKTSRTLASASTQFLEKPAPLRWTMRDVLWFNLTLLLFLHLQFPYSVYVLLFDTSLYTFLWGLFVMVYGGMGVTIGAHRLWAHRSFKASPAFQFVAMLCYSTVYQYDILRWVNTHRTHHRYADSDGDPHDSRRGFFYSHFGWLLIKEPESVTRARATIDMSDLVNNPAVLFNRKYGPIVHFLFTCLIPVAVPLLWGERFFVSYMVCFVFRYTYSLQITFTVNSLAHLYGSKPYDQQSNARQNALVIFLTAGEGWHNYHHAFPYDYRASEFPWFYNLSAVLIDFFALLGCVYDRRVASKDLIGRRKENFG